MTTTPSRHRASPVEEITVAQARAAIRALGIDPTHVTHVRIDLGAGFSHVTWTAIERDPYGRWTQHDTTRPVTSIP